MRLIKTIGDAAMLVSPEPPAMLDAALALVDAADAEGEDFPSCKAGIAFGRRSRRGGDWYGHTVNLASRVTAIARPSSVLATEEVHDAAGRRVPLVVRRRAPPEGRQAAGAAVARARPEAEAERGPST